MKEKFQQIIFWLKARKVVVFLASLFIIILIALFSILLLKTKEEVSQIPAITPIPTEEALIPPTLSQPLPPPQVFFETYDNRATLPQVPETVNTYSFKTNYSLDEIIAFGRKLGLNNYKEIDEKHVVLYNLEDPKDRGVLTFRTDTGFFDFQSYGEHRPQIVESHTSQVVATQFLTELGLLDPTVKFFATYHRSSTPGLVYVEFHRDWQAASLPIMNFVGLVNAPETKRLANAGLGVTDELTPLDPDIIFSSNGQGGKSRLDTFNTITVGVNEDTGTIGSIDYTMRQIVESQTVVADQLYSPGEALTKITNHQAQLSLTLPAGKGFIAPNIVWPNNQAYAKIATITDFALVYLEKDLLQQQEKTVPMYLIKGTAELTSGITVKFVETIPALRSNLSFLSTPKGLVAGETTTSDKSIKLGTFPTIPVTPMVTPLPTPSITLIWPTTSYPTPETIRFREAPLCKSGFGDARECPCMATNSFEIPGLGRFGYSGDWVRRGDQGWDHVIYFLDYGGEGTMPLPYEELREKVYQLFEDQYVINVSRAILEKSLSYQSWVSASDVQSDLPRLNECSKYYSNRPEYCIRCAYIYYAGEWECTSWPAPPPDRDIVTGGADPSYYDYSQLRSMRQKVAERVWQLIQSGNLQAEAEKPNIFPTYMNEDLSRYFWTRSFAVIGHPQQGRCRLGDNSPSLYFYPKSKTYVSLSLPKTTTYEDVSERNFYSYPVGTIGNDNWERTRFYYRYQRINFTELKEGFVVERDEWEEFIRETVAPQLGLTERETADLVVDVRNALVDIENKDYQYLKISFVDRKELDEKLPISISPQPDTFHRVHLLLTPLESYQKVDQPKLNQLPRNGFTVVEVGAGIR